MWPFKTRNTPPKGAWWRRVMAVEDRCEGLETRVDNHYAELKALRGLVNSMRAKKHAEDAPQGANGDDPVPEAVEFDHTPPMSMRGRFRGF